MNKRRVVAASLLFATLGACKREVATLVPESRDGGPAMLEGLKALEIDPPTIQLLTNGTTLPPSAVFTAIGTFEDGTRDVTAAVIWSIDDERVGSIAEGRFDGSGLAGATTIFATSGAIETSAEIFVRLELIAYEPGTPSDAEYQFPANTSADIDVGPDQPLIVYPSDQTKFPRNISNVAFQWRAEPRFDLFELRFDSSVSSIRYYTTAKQFALDATSRRWIAESNAGRTVTMNVRAKTQTSTAIHAANPIEIGFSESEVIGALYYWSTGSKGINRATLAAPLAAKFYADPDDADGKCVACHTISRDGRRLSAGYDGERLRIVTIPDREVLAPSDPNEDGPEYGWGTFDPGATRLLYANKGQLTLLNADDGAVIEQVALPGDTQVTHPDWSPDGRHVAVAVAGDKDIKNKSVEGTSIARMSVQPDGSFAAPETIVASTGDEDTLFFPAYSPDSRWIAFVRTTGKSKDSKPAELYVVRSDGSAPPILLERLNRTVRHEMGIVDIGNSMPTWAPSTEPSINWLAFSSLRDYGDVLVDTQRDQLWGAAIDLDLAAAGRDPSLPAFWMPFQGLDEGNHRAYWAHDTEEECPSTVEICDDLDNDCDGIVDEGCCTPTEEICGNGLDEDCDAVPDDGCDCVETEDCQNGLDDDCDGLVDIQDEDCGL